MIDSHHHFWKYDPQQYGWIGAGMERLRRDFLPADLEAVAKPAGITGVVSVQARQSLQETRWLLELAGKSDLIKGVVGWAPLIDPGVDEVLEEIARDHKLRAVRHVLQDEADDAYALREDFNRGIGQLKRLNLRYDILIYERQLRPAIALVDRHPDQIFVLDHIAKPRIRAGEIEPWRSNIRELARRPSIYCKLSGMVTEADWQRWTPDQLRSYIETVLEAFTPQRLMLGSDWPVCLVACKYGRWVELVKTFVAKLSAAEQRRILGETAVEAYGLQA